MVNGKYSCIHSIQIRCRGALNYYKKDLSAYGAERSLVSLEFDISLLRRNFIQNSVLVLSTAILATFSALTPIEEVLEGEGGGGSSTMPHKANPRASNMIQTLARMGWMYASGAPAMLDQQDVRAASMRVLNWTILPEASNALSVSLGRAKKLLFHLIVNKDRMRANFDCSKFFIMPESITVGLENKINI